MEIHGYSGAFVALIPLFGGDLSGVEAPSLHCSCAMAAHRFAGATEPGEPIIRVDVERLHRFVDGLRDLEQERRGTATLDEPQLRLSLTVYDRAGHMRLSASLTDYQPEGDHHVDIAFEVDPTTLPRILEDFEELLQFPRSSTG